MEKVIDIEERIPSMRAKRRRKTNRKFLFILMIFVIALLAILYFQSPISKINEIIVIGATLHNEKYYKEESGLLVDEPIWGFSTSKIENSLKEIDGVKSVTVSRKWLRDIEIAITEWSTVAYIQEDGHYSLLLENGDAFPAEMVSPETEAPILNRFRDPDVRKRIATQLMKMPGEVYTLISEIVFTGSDEDTESVTVYMDDGYEVRAIIPTFAESMSFYPEVTAQLNGLEKGVIDMEVGMFFKPFSEVYGPNEVQEEGDSDAEETE
jgi:cell division protein FtsQ